MLGHKTSLNKFRKIEIISRTFSESRNQLQEENWEKHRHIEAKKHASKQPMSEYRNQRGNLKIP